MYHLVYFRTGRLSKKEFEEVLYNVPALKGRVEYHNKLYWGACMNDYDYWKYKIADADQVLIDMKNEVIYHETAEYYGYQPTFTPDNKKGIVAFSNDGVEVEFMSR